MTHFLPSRKYSQSLFTYRAGIRCRQFSCVSFPSLLSFPVNQVILSLLGWMWPLTLTSSFTHTSRHIWTLPVLGAIFTAQYQSVLISNKEQ